ncbi:hypothetical protein [Bacteroides sp. 519]|uniref:hypothetical protein n=1 Tax=Bacteroides sp. 519 TaxID=2302937 RepID=UPI0013D2A559|nr:hypothetical protein [Bacteroides sp. 519]
MDKINKKTEDRNLMAIHKSSDTIPGLPYTCEERIASVRRGTEDILTGRTVTMETLRTKHPRI